MADVVMLDRGTLDLGDLDLSALEEGSAEFISYERSSRETVIERAKDARIIITNKVVIDAEVMAACPRLALICVVATGVNNIDTDSAAARGVQVVNCRGYGTDSVAQHAIGFMLALSTGLVSYVNAVRSGRWEQAPDFCFLDFPIRELASMKLLVVGYGELGRAVARLAEAHGMEILIAERPGVESPREGRVAFDEAVAEADVITLHCPLNDQTRHLIDEAVLLRMKPTAFVINTARGGIVDEQALADALRRGEIGGAGMDVLTEEPPRQGNPLLQPDIPNLLVTPHSAWGSRRARQRIVEQTVENINAWEQGDPVRIVV
ncbi:2-hydroxyacid dehydrogenase [Spiribacter sp. 2438]|uniref:2-hydroxyacid dehydrogenase n=1 Tax=Spiribacter sp. 2438 TaxID=2666185 RepID=UPI0012AF7649|nr:2-hydroxyacid dehydrogenase [Spiribacter sp. 2438]QGM21584.1 2-hydroxyacid dehydrogenase [Spiribacter sp. 2438]